MRSWFLRWYSSRVCEMMSLLERWCASRVCEMQPWFYPSDWHIALLPATQLLGLSGNWRMSWLRMGSIILIVWRKKTWWTSRWDPQCVPCDFQRGIFRRNSCAFLQAFADQCLECSHAYRLFERCWSNARLKSFQKGHVCRKKLKPCKLICWKFVETAENGLSLWIRTLYHSLICECWDCVFSTRESYWNCIFSIFERYWKWKLWKHTCRSSKSIQATHFNHRSPMKLLTIIFPKPFVVMHALFERSVEVVCL